MASRKRQSDTTVTTGSSSGLVATSKEIPARPQPKTKLRVRIKRYHAVAKWTWNAGSDDEVCGICQSAYEGVAPGVKYPGDECPVVFGKCGHACHLQCITTWLNQKDTCPFCRQTWEFGQTMSPTNASASDGGEGAEQQAGS
mmetsp:Transcript_10388/g.28611  ORF Transcript_10388/g.28611 Transcript_10388/m.28611 type:complete len:142 (+) Transcript_10388:285-710(+)